MPRTDLTAVGLVIELDDAIDVVPFINAANELVTEVCANQKKVDGSPFYTDLRLTMIETWLAAHFYAIRDPRMTSVSPAGVSVKYQRTHSGMGLNSTDYGQQVLRLDTKCGLAALEKKALKGGGKVGMFWLGTDTLASAERERILEETEEERLL